MHDIDGKGLCDLRHRLFFHIDETRAGNEPQGFTADEHQPAGRPVAVGNDGDVTALLIEAASDADERLEQNLGGIGNENQIVIVVIGGQITQHTAGAAILGAIALDSEGAEVIDGGGDRLG